MRCSRLIFAAVEQESRQRGLRAGSSMADRPPETVPMIVQGIAARSGGQSWLDGIDARVSETGARDGRGAPSQRQTQRRGAATDGLSALWAWR